MSTHSSISVKLPNGKYVGIYCHFDGYPEGPHGVGYILQKHYNSLRRVQNLVELGDIAVLGGSLKTERDHGDGGTIAYHRDRGEAFRRSEGATWREVKQNFRYCSYDYLFEDGRWVVSSRYGR